MSEKFLPEPIFPSVQDYMMYCLGKSLDHSHIRTVASIIPAESQGGGLWLIYSVG